MMAEIHAKPELGLKVRLTITEGEARALDALAGYGDDAFIKTFYKECGRHYLEPHEASLRLFLKTVRDLMPGVLSRMDNARKAFGNN
jgi:hypothetical protein